MSRGMVRSDTRSLVEFFADLRQDYRAARESRLMPRLTGVSAMGSGADFHYRSSVHFIKIIERARMFERDDMVVGQGIERVVDNVLQEGIRLDPQTGDDAANDLLADKFQTWAGDAEACDLAGEMTLHEQARSALRQTIVDGDILFLGLRTGELEGIEAHRLRTPSAASCDVVHGVKLSEHRKRVEYWITKEEVNPYRTLKLSEVSRVRTRDAEGLRQVFHVYNPKRISQTRGVSALVPVTECVGLHNDLQFAMLVKAQTTSAFAILEEVERGVSAPVSSKPTGEKSTETLPDGGSRDYYGLAPGMHYKAPPGHRLHGFSPNVPNKEFFDHATLILTFIAINLKIPLAVLMLDPRETNFSGWRGAIDQARIGFKQIQGWMIGRFFDPIFMLKLHQWTMPGPLRDPKIAAVRSRLGDAAFFRHQWIKPTWGYIEPVKDVKADAERRKERLASLQQIHAERGRDWDRVAPEIVNGNALLIEEAIKRAQELNDRYQGANVDWRELCEMTAGRPAPVPEADDEDDDNEEAEKDG